MLDYRIETFLCVCKHMNYTKAAKELNITQPGVSQHIKYLEDYYGENKRTPQKRRKNKNKRKNSASPYQKNR